MAAKHHQTIAEMYENEANDLVSFSFFVSILGWEFFQRVTSPIF
jgi:hypothetical protein